jgi:L-alanine-DL-glutamate epimerase-like enolase superfamily enzyme
LGSTKTEVRVQSRVDLDTGPEATLGQALNPWIRNPLAPIREVFSAIPAFTGGCVGVEDKPGLGIDVNEAAAKKRP